MSDKTIMKNSLLRILHFFIVRIRFVLLLISYQIMRQFSFRFFRTILHDCPVCLLTSPFRNISFRRDKALLVLAKRPVRSPDDPSDESLPENIARLRILLLEVLLHCFRQRCITRFITLHNLRGRLIHHNDMVVFINYGHKLSMKVSV